MGIPKLNKFILKKLDEINGRGVEARHLDDYDGKSFAVDISFYIYQSLSSGHIQGIFNLISKLKQFGIIPILVFDGRPEPEKNFTLKQRKQKKNGNKSKIIDLEQSISDLDSDYLTSSMDSINPESDDDYYNELSIQEKLEKRLVDSEKNLEFKKKEIKEEIKKLKKRCFEIKYNHIVDIKEMLDILNIKYIHLPNYEADLVCSELVKNGLADFTMTNDMDLLALGCPKNIRGFNFKDNNVVEYDTKKICESLEITQEQFTDLCIMFKTDYNHRISSMDNDEIFELLKKYGNIENILIHSMKDDSIKIFNKFTFDKSRKIFNQSLSLEELVIINNEEIYIEDRRDIVYYLVSNCPKLNRNLINKKLDFIIGKNKTYYTRPIYDIYQDLEITEEGVLVF